MKTENLPHRHPARPYSTGAFRILTALLLAAIWMPAFAVQPATKQDTDTSFDTASPALASPAAPALTAIAIPPALALPVTAPAAALPAPALPALASELVAPPIAAALATPDMISRGVRVPAPQPAAASTADRSLVRTVLQRAFTLLGTPYRWGGTSPESGFDCSGLVGYVFRTIGIDLPRVSRAMAGEGTPVTDRNALAEGDLVFFGRRGHVDHVGIYIGDGKFLHAPRTGRDVTVSSLSTGYWSQKFLEARRLAVGN